MIRGFFEIAHFTIQRIGNRVNTRVYLSGFFIAACLAQFAPVVDAQPFLPSHSQVILLSGVPGDLESETAYKDQLGAWLQVIEQQAPEAIVALTDNPDSGTA